MKPFQSTTVRLAALYTGVFAMAVLILGIVTVLATRSALRHQLDGRIQSEALALAQEYKTEGLQGVVEAVNERDKTPGALDYGLEDVGGRPLAGRLAGMSVPSGWSTIRSADAKDGVRLLTIGMAGGRRLMVGEDLERTSSLDKVVVNAFAFAFLGVLAVGVGSGFALSRDMRRRFVEMSGAAEAIIDGDLARRIPVRGSGDELDSLAATLNRMLDRIATLMESIRQVSNDIAHDLRTPLTHLKQRLEADLNSGAPQSRRSTLESALVDLDSILDTFAALLRIAHIDSGARRAGFRKIELSALAMNVLDAFGPSAEEGGRSLIPDAMARVWIEGDAELLTQMLVNIVENALRHTPPDTIITVATGADNTGAYLLVRDNGPGVPGDERHRLFDRFYRLERSRSTPGEGLGLALVAAVARLHSGRAELLDAKPGLAVRVSLPLDTV